MDNRRKKKVCAYYLLDDLLNLFSSEYAWAFPETLPNRSFDMLELAGKCYECAYALAKRNASLARIAQFEPTLNVIVDDVLLARRLGNLNNVIGIVHVDILKDAVLNGTRIYIYTFFSYIYLGLLPEYTLGQLGIDQTQWENDDQIVEHIVDRGIDYLKRGIQLFHSVADAANEALLYSNCGQLCRLRFHFIGHRRADCELSAVEQQLMLKV